MQFLERQSDTQEGWWGWAEGEVRTDLLLNLAGFQHSFCPVICCKSVSHTSFEANTLTFESASRLQHTHTHTPNLFSTALFFLSSSAYACFLFVVGLRCAGVCVCWDFFFLWVHKKFEPSTLVAQEVLTDHRCSTIQLVMGGCQS